MIVGDTDVQETFDNAQMLAAAEWRRLELFEHYYRGQHDLPYQPQTATAEFRVLRRRSTTNLTRLIVHTLVQRLIVDGYKASATALENAAPWQWWQANGLDSRQKALYTEVAKHGYAFMQVLPGGMRDDPTDNTPVMRPVSPREWYCHYDAFADDWPAWAVRRRPGPDKTWDLADDATVRTVTFSEGKVVTVDGAEHGLGVCPFVIYRNEWDLGRWPLGEIEPVIAVQDRLNQTVFDLLVAQTYAAAPQKYIAGLSAPTDQDGQPIIDLRAFAKSVWLDPNPDAKFGSLPEANLANLVTAIDSTLRVYGLMSQTPPHYLLGQIVNLSAEALLAADTTLSRKVADSQALHGESHEQAFALAAVAAGNEATASDESAQVWWRDVEPRSIGQEVDALGKLALMLEVPKQALWQKVPGVTATDLALWRSEAARQRLAAAVAAARQPQAQPGTMGQPGMAPPDQTKAVAAQLKDQAV